MGVAEKKADPRRSGEGYDPNDPLRLFLWGPEAKQLLTVKQENELIGEIQVHHCHSANNFLGIIQHY